MTPQEVDELFPTEPPVGTLLVMLNTSHNRFFSFVSTVSGEWAHRTLRYTWSDVKDKLTHDHLTFIDCFIPE